MFCIKRNMEKVKFLEKQKLWQVKNYKPIT